VLDSVGVKLLRRLVRIPGVPGLWQRLGVGSLPLRIQFDVTERPAYAYGVYSAAVQAKRLGQDAISVLELGVAGGKGLLALERLAESISKEVGVGISVLGFDSGKGMPPPVDYRDLPHVWGQGFYQMDVGALRAKLGRAELVLGDVGETVPKTVGAGRHPPIGFVSFDLDYYSSTKAAFRMFDFPASTRLPRVYCYFDDITGPEIACMNEYVGELLSIKEFNDEHGRMKISKVVSLWTERERPNSWNEKIYVCHDFDHPTYTTNVMPDGDEYRQIALP
jgi:hypothetical protein